jgi:DNA modification methylase
MTVQAPDDPYVAFLKAKVTLAAAGGFEVAADEINPSLIRHQPDCVRWMCRGGRRALFANFGLGKSVMQMEVLSQVARRFGGRQLIVAPFGVHPEFEKDAADILGIAPPRFIRRIEEAGATGLYITNFETVRDGKLDPHAFVACSLDEADVLRGMGGTKTFREFMRLFEGVRFKFVATATPDPNELIELLAYAAFLEVMDVGQAKTRFFKRDSEHADKLTLHPHKEQEFWLWVASWALFIDKPSDLGHSDEGYALPPLKVVWHEVTTAAADGGTEKSGQHRLFRDASLGLVEAAREKRDSLGARVARMRTLVEDHPEDRWIIWHDLEAERAAIEAALPTVVSIFGAQPVEVRAECIRGFGAGWFQHLAAKPSLAGAGCNFQRHCRKAVFVGLSCKFRDLIQAIHRIYRFLQPGEVEVHLIYSAAERGVRGTIERKWRLHTQQRAKMSQIIQEFGLSQAAMTQALARSMFDEKERVEVRGDGYRLAKNDCVFETRAMASDSVDLVVTSIPFSTQYEYSPSFNDFGHTDDNAHFFEQMGFLLPQLLRVLKPGRVAAIHVKDRVVPGGLTGLGFQTVYPFADDVRVAARQAGFAYLGEKTNLTDVVRENNQTYRLGHTMELTDGTRIGAGLPEKVLLFRKPPSDSSNGFADDPVAKPRSDYVDKAGRRVKYDRSREQAGEILPVPGTGYSRARWQVDAHHLSRSDGDRLVMPHEWPEFDGGVIFRLWKAYGLSRIYDFEYHVAIGEHLAFRGRLPPDFMQLPVHSWHPDVWTDVMQARGMNTLAAQQDREKHICPLPFDIVDRLIVQFSQPGETVFDPFGGLMTVPYRAVALGRQGAGCELNATYFTEGVRHVEAMVREMATPTLFDVIGERTLAEVAA